MFYHIEFVTLSVAISLSFRWQMIYIWTDIYNMPAVSELMNNYSTHIIDFR
jgi:hypothetical protein